MRGRLFLRAFAVTSAAALLGLALAGGVAGGTLPPGDPDQEQTDASANGYGFDMPLAQTFTAGVSGQLSYVAINAHGVNAPEPAMVAAPAAVPPTTLEITNVSGGAPGGTILAAVTATLPESDAWYYFVFSSPPTLSAGTQYAIVLTLGSPMATNHWNGTCSDAYGDGEALLYNETWQAIPAYSGNDICIEDFAFRTFMIAPDSTSTPPPTTAVPAGSDREGGSALPALIIAALAGVGIGILGVRRVAAQR